MFLPRLRRLAAACRLSLILIFVTHLSAAAAAAATLSGRIVDPDGRPVAGARVILTDALGTRADRSTAADGRFEIAALAAGTYELRVVADGFTADPIGVTLAANDTRDVPLQMRLAAIAESIVVSASQVDVPLSRAPDSVTVVTAAELRARQSETVADALRFVPGLAVVRQGERGALTSLFPRGGGSNYTLVLIDGIRVNSFGGGYDFGHLALSNVDRIEIVRGPQSALFGSDGIGGVVQIVTRQGGAPRVDGLIEGGSQGTMRTAVSTSGSNGPWKWGAGVERARSDGFTGIAPASGETVTNDDDHLVQFSGSLGWQRPDGPEMLIATRVGRDERGSPGPFGSNPIGAFSGVDRLSRGTNNTAQASLRFSHPWSPRVRQRFEASYMDLSSDFASGFGPSFSGSHRFDVRLQENLALSSVLGASAGVESLRERGSSTFVTGANGTPMPIRRSVTGAFGELRYVAVNGLSVTGGVRVEHLTRDAVEQDAFGSRPAFPEQAIDSFNPKIAVSYLLPTAMAGRAPTRLHASAGTGIRPPDAFEIAFTDNPNLKPERTRSVDLGVEQQLAGGAYVFGVTAFLNRYDDLLVTVGASLQGASQYQTDNISNARARGLEFSADGRLLASVSVRATYTLLDTEILSVDGLDGTAPSPFKVGNPLVRRPRHQGGVTATYSAGRLTAFGELTSRSRTFDVEPNFGSFGGLFYAPGYAVMNIGGGVRLTPQLEAYVRVLNLADRQYEEAFGFPAMHRSGIVGLRVAASR